MIPPPDPRPGRPMDRARGELIERLFFEAADLRGQARRRFLDEQCAGDTDLRREVELLLNMDERASAGVLAQTPVAAADLPRAISASLHEAEVLPKWIGQYKALRRLGEGGFGLVYLAEQTAPIRRHVALKVIRPGMGSPQVVERFMAERQALALMDHPGVAKVFDAGTTDDGRPYFAMEFVDGVPITEFARRESLPIAARLELLIQVCDAVQHAHQKGVIHRDLKPTNILVEPAREGESGATTRADAGGRPKVIDFGIAKALAEPLTGQTLHTLSGQIVGTPEYMSPEQAGSASDVDTRGDVYSLGVVLYELLTGLLPFDSLRLRCSALADIQRIIREEEPLRPSDRLARAADEEASGTQGAASQSLGLDPRETSRRLRGELDWITGRAIEKDRDRRYPSAHELAADLRRHLSGEPVHASPPSRRYRLSKWAHRHKTLLAAGSVVSVAVLISLIATTWSLRVALREGERARDAERQARVEAQNARAAEGVAAQEARHAREAQRQADAEAARARTSAVTARRVSDFLERMLAGVGPVVAQGADTTILRQILDKAAADVGEQLVDEPLAEARLRHAIGASYHAIQRLEESVEHLERSVTLFRAMADPPLDEFSLALYDLGSTYHNLDRLEDAREYYSLALANELGPLNKPGAAAATLSDLALVALDANDLGAAQEYADRAMALFLEIGDGEDDSACLLRNTMAMIANERGDSERALALYRESLEISERLRGPNHPTTLTTRANVASQYTGMSRPAEAAAVLVQCVEDMRRVYGPGHSETITTMSNYGTALMGLGRLDEVGPIYEEAERLATVNLGEDHWLTQATRGNLARYFTALGDHGRAAEIFGAATLATEARHGAADLDARRFRNRYSESLRRAGRHAESEESAMAAAATAEAAGIGDALYVFAIRDVVLAKIARGDAEGSLEWTARMERAAEPLSGTAGHNLRAWAADVRGRALRLAGRGEEALAPFEASYTAWVEGYGVEDVDARRVAGYLAETLEDLGRTESAAEWRARATEPSPP